LNVDRLGASSYQWAMMATMCFKVQKLVWLHRWKRMWFYFYERALLGPLKSTWQCWSYQSWLWWFVLKPSFMFCMGFFLIHLKNF
jgi:hypothetical protein